MYSQVVFEYRKGAYIRRRAGGALRHLAPVATDEFALRENVPFQCLEDLFLRGPARQVQSRIERVDHKTVAMS